MIPKTIEVSRILSQALWGLVTIIGLIAGFLGLRIALDWRAAGALTSQSLAMEKQLQTGPPQVAAETGDATPHGLSTLRVLQAAVTDAASKNGCQLAEFRAGTTIAPYIPHYRKDIPPGDWSQMDAHFTLSGHLRDVIESLRRLGNLNLAIEIDSVNLTRETIDSDGSAIVDAQVQLRTISQGAAS